MQLKGIWLESDPSHFVATSEKVINPLLAVRKATGYHLTQMHVQIPNRFTRSLKKELNPLKRMFIKRSNSSRNTEGNQTRKPHMMEI